MTLIMAHGGKVERHGKTWKEWKDMDSEIENDSKSSGMRVACPRLQVHTKNEGLKLPARLAPRVFALSLLSSG